MINDKTKQQRDRFLAFSFASADLFIEVAPDETVAYALGAASSLTGIDANAMKGEKWFNLFSPSDRILISNMKDQAKMASRCGPLLVKLDEKFGGGRQAILTGIRMPDHDNFYMTIGFTSVLMSQYAQATQPNQNRELLDKDGFIIAAQDALGLAKSLGQDLELMLVNIEEIKTAQKRFGPDLWADFSDRVKNLLNSKSIDGQAAAQIMEGRYSIIHDSTFDHEALKQEIAALSQELDPEGKGFDVETKSVTADLSLISERDTTKALIYTINEFERKGTTLSIESLNSGFKAYVSANAQKIVQFKTMVEQLNFDLHFQPIVNFHSGELSHFEMLSRFKDAGSTHEWIIFGEDIGMAADLDIAVCERAINYLLYKASGRRTKFAINLSGQSMQNEQFFRTLHAKLALNKELADRIIFEITESTNMQNLDMASGFIQTLQNDGFKVCLDDFGAGSGSFQYLHKLPVDYVKIDGSYTRKILTSDRDSIMVKNLVQMCHDLDVKVIAEMIESDDQAQALRTLGIDYGQGYLFGKPSAKPEYASIEMTGT